MRKIIKCFFQPYRWQSSPLCRGQIAMIFFAMLSFFSITAICNNRWEFPHFYLFFTAFSVVLLSALFAETHYTVQINRIRAQTAGKKGFMVANARFTQFEQSKWAGTIALMVVVIFAVGGVSIYGSIKITPTLILCLVYFSIVVYLSIIGYVQYILLFAYIVILVCDKNEFTKVGQELTDALPAEINWLHNLTKLTHSYRSIFFTVGAFYIGAFWFYCSSPNFGVILGHWVHYILWAIIFLAIVIVFPIVSLVEFRLIKELVTKVKRAFIAEVKIDLARTNSIKPLVERRILGDLFTTSVLQSASYPIKNRLGVTYAAILAILNFVGSIDTAIQLGSQLFIP